MAKSPEEESLDVDALLADVKSIVEDAADTPISLDDILAEYGVDTHPAQRPVPRRAPEKKPPAPPKNVISFPAAPPPAPPEPPEEEEEEPPCEAHHQLESDPLTALFPPREQPEDEWEEDEEEEDEETVLEFPQEKGMFSSLLRNIDRQADRMFEGEEELDVEEARRLEQFIPGTDAEEDAQEEDQRESVIQWMRSQWPAPPDTPPRQLAAKYHRGLFGLRLREFFVFLLAMVALVPMVLPLFSLVLPPHLTQDPLILAWAQVALLGAGMLLSIDLLLVGLWRGIRFKFGADSLLAVAAIASLCDSIYLVYYPNDQRPLSYYAITLMALWIQLNGAFHKRMAQHLSCHTAAAAQTPYLVTLDEKKWNAKDTYCKWSGSPHGFGSQMQMDDGGQRFFALLCPFLMAGCVVVTVQRWTGGDLGLTLWTASATLTAACALGAPLCYSRSARKLEQRLEHSGATLAGWMGVRHAHRGNRVLLTDTDLFPPGSVTFKTPRFFQGYGEQKVVGYTAGLLTATDCGLTPMFETLLRSYGGLPRKVENPLFHEGGGVSGRIWHDEVLVGSASFMNLMGVALQPGIHVNQTVFCAINGNLAGMFPLDYRLHDTIAPAVYTLLSEGIAPILATRDFNLIPNVLSSRSFQLPAQYMDFPVVERRRELSDAESDHNETITAVLCREGLLPFSEAVVAAKRLRIATRTGGFLCVLGGGIGIFLMAYLTSVEAFTSASPLNLLIFLLMWLAPVWLLTEWSHRF